MTDFSPHGDTQAHYAQNTQHPYKILLVFELMLTFLFIYRV